MPKKTTKRKNLNELYTALDLMMTGNHSSVVGSDFLMSRKTNPNYGYIDPDDIKEYNQDFIDTIIKLKPINKIEVPKNLELLSNQYTDKRKIIEKFDHANYDNAMASGIEAAKELGNYNEFSNKIVLLNDSEMNIFFDYIALYRELDGKRAIINWDLKNPDLINEENKELIKAYEQANFSLLRLDKNLDHGAIKVTDIISQNEYILIDKALNRSKKEGLLYACSILNLNDYIISSGGGLPLDPKSTGGKTVLTILSNYLDKIRNSNDCFSPDVRECVRKMYGLALRGGALHGMTIG